MSAEPEPGAPSSITHDLGDATVELELTAAEQLALSQAATGTPRQSDASSAQPPYDVFTCRRTARIDFVCTVTFVAVIVCITAATGWHALVAQPAASPAVLASALPPTPTPQAQPPPPVVQVLNPFDATEVFEFPAETTQAEAHDAIAELLMQRARDRRRPGLILRRVGNHDSPPIGANDASEMFVTRLSDAANRVAGDLNPHPETRTAR